MSTVSRPTTDMPELPCELQCPKCTHRVWCSEEDPDAGFSEMWRHVYWLHALTEGRETSAAQTLTARLMTQVAVIPCV